MGEVYVPEDPRLWGLPHNEWRQYQRDTVGWLLDNDGGPSARILEAVTGSGKSATARAMSQLGKVLVLTRTKSLQNAYGDLYNADVLFGKANYPCPHMDSLYPNTAEECVMSREKRRVSECPWINQCEFWQRKFAAMESNFCCLNYSLFLAERGRWPTPDVLVMDEAHLLADIVLDHCGTTIHYKTALEWGLPRFPTLTSAEGGLMIKRPNPVPGAIDWLTDCCVVFEREMNRFQNSYRKEDRDHAKEAERHLRNFQAVISALDASDDLNAWFIRSGPNVLKEYRGSEMEPGFVCRPLTARYHFKDYFVNGFANQRWLLMSATIGDFETFAHSELGIKGYAARAVPNQWAPETRPIYVLTEVPRMSHSATAADFEKQAEEIGKILTWADPSWSGIVHTTRISEAKLLGERLMNLGYGDRIYIPPTGLGTNAQVRAWHQRLREKPNSIIVSWFMHEGYDGREEKINVIAKIPYPVRGEAGSYENELANYDAKVYKQRAARQLMQMCGRTRRGNREDYDVDGEMNGLVVIADSALSGIMKYLSEDFRAALVKV